MFTCDNCFEDSQYLLADGNFLSVEIGQERLICELCFGAKHISTIASVMISHWFKINMTRFSEVQRKKTELALNFFLNQTDHSVESVNTWLNSVSLEEKVLISSDNQQEIDRQARLFEANQNCTL